MMKKNKSMLRLSVLLLVLFVSFGHSAFAKENVSNSDNKTSGDEGLAIRNRAMGCTAPTSSFDISVNNVKARLMNGGDMWWDFNNAAYEIPKGGGVSSLFAGAIWIGGIDGGGQLKVAAQTYRQSGSDFFAGPLDVDGNTTAETCNEWDKHYEVLRVDIDAFEVAFEAGDVTEDFIQSTAMAGIRNWPAKNNPYNDIVGSKNMAAFVDYDGDGDYNPLNGDYPKLDLAGGRCSEKVINPDQMVYWVYNDKGNLHGETGAEAIGLEIQASAFAFATNDQINDMTFYRYRVANKSSIVLNNTYMAQWVDADLGAYDDDFVGCDTSRSLGICYNGDAVDGPTSPNYSDNPPIVGIDFFEGPKDTAGLELGMAVFLYYNNDFTNTGNPETAPHYYGYMSGTWKDGVPFTAGGNGYGGSVSSNYMFPSDPSDASSETWSECSEGNTPADRRFLESAGPFVLLPGAVNNVTIGAVWSQPKNVYPCPSYKTIQTADDKAQVLFDNCFKLLEGPIAPEVEVRSLDKEIILTIINSKETEAYRELDAQILPNLENDTTFISGDDIVVVLDSTRIIIPADTSVDSSFVYDTSFAVDSTNGVGDTFFQTYTVDTSIAYDSSFTFDTSYTVVERDSTYSNASLSFVITKDTSVAYYDFQGYVVYQLANANVSASQLDDRAMARIVASVDKPDGVASLVNYGYDEELNYNIPYVKAEQAEDNGIRHTFKITEDLFATGAKELVNATSYYYTVVPYGYNNYKQFDPNTDDGITGQKLPYIESRVFKISPSYVAIPHVISVTGVELNSAFGDGPDIIKLSGSGNGGHDLELTDESLAQTLGGDSDEITYKAGKAPINVLVYDAYKVPSDVFTLHIIDSVGTDAGAFDSSSYWYILNSSDEQVARSDSFIGFENEQVIDSLGLIVKVNQSDALGASDAGVARHEDHGLITSEVDYSDDGQRWLAGVADEDGLSFMNWIRAGEFTSPDAQGFNDVADDVDHDGEASTPTQTYFKDPNAVYESLFPGTDIEGTWAPAELVNSQFSGNYTQGSSAVQLLAPLDGTSAQLEESPSIDIVFTTDQSKWTVVPVLETQDEEELSWDGATERLDIKLKAGYATASNLSISNTNNGEAGLSFFPGYAINLETGQRLCLMIGEDSWLKGDNGDDMLWNPTSNLSTGSFATRNWKYGGKHYVYVVNRKYAADAVTEMKLAFDNRVNKLRLMQDVAWVGVPMLAEGFKFSPIDSGYVPNDIKLKIRVSQPISRTVDNGTATYRFNTGELAKSELDAAAADSVLDMVNVVPNPYYGFSEYESSQLDNTVKITNLPENCVISVFSIDGSLIRKFDRTAGKDEFNNQETSLEWDIKNYKNIPIASGVYLIHIDAGDGRERTIKWFGIMRPQDLSSF
jgi:hypothetical protein